MKKVKLFLFLLIAVMAIGCGKQTEEPAITSEALTEESAITSEAVTEEPEIISEEIAEEQETQETFEKVAKLLGMQDSETKDMLGGGEENWTEDRSFYIGRIYEANLYGEACSVYTTCNADSIVDSVSVWIVNGSRSVTDEEAQKWETHISEYVGMQSAEEKVGEESGNRQKKWMKDGKIVTLNRMEDILTINFQEMVGELK